MQAYSAIAAVVAVCSLFALQHSLLVTDWAKALARRALGEAFVRAYYRLGFSIISLAALTAFVLAYLSIPDITLWEPPLWLTVALRLGQLGAVIFAVRSFTAVGLWEFTGLSQASRHIRGSELQGDPEGIAQKGLVTAGAYGHIRHPLYLAGILVFSFSPEFTRNHITLVICADIYFVIGALIEERRLIAHFGDEYRRYMAEVPRFIPSLRKAARRKA